MAHGAVRDRDYLTKREARSASYTEVLAVYYSQPDTVGVSVVPARKCRRWSRLVVACRYGVEFQSERCRGLMVVRGDEIGPAVIREVGPWCRAG